MLCYLRRTPAVRPTVRARFMAGMCVLVAFVSSTVESGAAGPAAATTSTPARKEAIKSIPLGRIHPKYRQAVRQVLTDPSVYRRLPTEVIDCHGPLFTFFAQNPEVLVSVWRQLGVSKVQLIRTGPDTFRLADGSGTTGHLVVVEQSCDEAAQNRIVMYATGRYEGKPFQRAVGAECVLLLRSGSVREADGREYVAARLDTFTRIDRASVELFAKAVHPLVGRTADQNFTDTLKFVGNLSYTAERRPDAIENLARKLDQVGPARKERFAKVAYDCADRRLARRSGALVSPDVRR